MTAQSKRVEIYQHNRPRRWAMESQLVRRMKVSLVLRMECQPVGVLSIHVVWRQGRCRLRCSM